MSADAVYNSIKLETPPSVCSTQAASALEEEASRFMFFEFDRIVKGDEKGILLLCPAEWNGVAVTGLAKLDYSPLFTSPALRYACGLETLQTTVSNTLELNISIYRVVCYAKMNRIAMVRKKIMLCVMHIFTGTDLHKLVLRVMVNAYSTYYLQIRSVLCLAIAYNCEDFPEPELEMPLSNGNCCKAHHSSMSHISIIYMNAEMGVGPSKNKRDERRPWRRTIRSANMLAGEWTQRTHKLHSMEQNQRQETNAKHCPGNSPPCLQNIQ
ncbi:hypothetical protein ARMGADRAFT_1038900 [Armillaria gallica]|uniref:Uncharacterized protein n=1 Tax=Armillaria gallica TaxID=47427 RepID=A0A2H3CLC1_ARMGA|nr:hypothetical protein ARMGADRAFT_1038900 [Armillaria gallica]